MACCCSSRCVAVCGDPRCCSVRRCVFLFPAVPCCRALRCLRGAELLCPTLYGAAACCAVHFGALSCCRARCRLVQCYVVCHCVVCAVLCVFCCGVVACAVVRSGFFRRVFPLVCYLSSRRLLCQHFGKENKFLKKKIRHFPMQARMHASCRSWCLVLSCAAGCLPVAWWWYVVLCVCSGELPLCRHAQNHTVTLNF